MLPSLEPDANNAETDTPARQPCTTTVARELLTRLKTGTDKPHIILFSSVKIHINNHIHSSKGTLPSEFSRLIIYSAVLSSNIKILQI